MPIIQAAASGPVTYRRSRDLKTLTLRTSGVISAPEIFGGCAVSPPPPAPAPALLPGYGPRAVIPDPYDPAQAGLVAAGFTLNDGPYELAWSPSACADGPDYLLPLLPGAVQWSSLVEGVSIEAGFDWISVPSNLQQSSFIGLADATGDHMIALGWMGARETGAVPEMGALVRIAGVDVIRTPLVGFMDQPGSGQYAARLQLFPAFGGAVGRRAVRVETDARGTGWASGSTELDSMGPISLAQWEVLRDLLVAGELAPAIFISHRAGGPAASDRLYWTAVRFA